MTTIKCFGLTENQVAHAVCMYADDNMTDNLYALHEVLCDENVRENILAIDENVDCDEDYLNDMVNFINSLNDGDWHVYAMTDEWASRKTIRIEGIIAIID